MPTTFDPGASKLAVIADVGRRAVRLGLTDEAGQLRRETIRAFEPSEQSTISGALSAFGHACRLDRLPRRCAIAVSGAAVGDIISVTNSRWFVSRSGLAAMLQAPPLILNDFAAHAWAISAADSGARFDAIAGPALAPAGPGTRCLIGVGSGLGVAVVSQDARGRVTVLPTEAGHCHFMDGLPELRPVLLHLRKTRGALTAEDLLSERGLLAIYRAVVEIDGGIPRATDTAGVIQLALAARDASSARAVDLFARALWYFAGNMALAYGAWDGMMLTGSIAHALRGLIRQPAASFILDGPYHRQLREIPRAMVALDHAELHGAAQALLLH
ncbi:MAG: glucokinase [Pseudomonadota bacterium]